MQTIGTWRCSRKTPFLWLMSFLPGNRGVGLTSKSVLWIYDTMVGPMVRPFIGLDEIEEVTVEESPAGQHHNYGTVIIHCVDGRIIHRRYIENARELKDTLLKQIAEI